MKPHHLDNTGLNIAPGFIDPSLPKHRKGYTKPSHNCASQLQDIQDKFPDHNERLTEYLRRKTTEDENTY